MVISKSFINQSTAAGQPAAGGYLNIVILHDQFSLLKLVLNTTTMQFHKKMYTFSLVSQLPYFEQSNRKAFTLSAFD